MTKRDPPYSPESLFEDDTLGWIVEGIAGHEAGHAGEAAGSDVEASASPAQKPIPMVEPSKGPLDMR